MTEEKWFLVDLPADQNGIKIAIYEGLLHRAAYLLRDPMSIPFNDWRQQCQEWLRDAGMVGK